MLEVTHLRRGLPRRAVLVHGLFSNAAFWLPWLRHLEGFQLALVGIDYATVLGSGMPLDALAGQIDALLAPDPAHLICHSFGGMVGMHSTRHWQSRTFLCPTFAAASIDSKAFCTAITERTGISPPTAAPQIAQALAHKAGPLPDPRWSPADLVCLPDDDPYFDYALLPDVACLHYAGGHFDVGIPLAALAGRLV